ncbi:apoptosis-enhancing nuclease-like [Dendronephthya gigantea]|uniref:apoptosis-enhancing nuclease-like n=1 Tax=Dendronephthya gigantea TaxID=151771 RepID=UPI00106C92C4|nr:apoptosis-enhancing nuclease-like [Dendronephthya gigantea]
MRLKRELKESLPPTKRLKTLSPSVVFENEGNALEEGEKLSDNSSECSADYCPSTSDCSSSINEGESSTEIPQCLSLDCEMVGVGVHRSSSLARCSVVNYDGDVVCDVYVKPELPVTDYRTKWSGIHKGDLSDGCTFQEARKQVRKIIKGCRLVGHSLHSDLHALNLSHPRHLMRDTSKYWPMRGLAGLQNNVTPSLKCLASILLSRTIQDGEHCSVEDAHAAMSLYKLCEQQWEKEIRGELSNQSYLSDLYWPSWTRTG